MATALLENFKNIKILAEMSIGTDRGRWWADTDFGSDLWLLQREKVDDGTAGQVRQELLRCTAWLITEGLAASIEATATRSGKNEITYEVTIIKPDGTSVLITEVWHGL